MNSKKFLVFLLLVVLLFTVVRAQEEAEGGNDVVEDNGDEGGEDNGDVDIKDDEAPVEEPVAVDDPAPIDDPKPSEVKKEPSSSPVQVSKPSNSNQSKSQPSQPHKQSSSSSSGNSKPAPVSNSKPASSGNTSNSSSAASNNSKPAQSNNAAAAPAAAAAGAGAAGTNASAPLAFKATTSSAVAPTNGSVVPQTNPGAAAAGNNSANTKTGDIKNDSGSGGSSAVKGTVISIVAVGAVVGVATVGVRAYNKKTSESNRSAELGDIEAQPMKDDFGTTNYDNGDYMAPEDYNPYNIMNDTPNEPYATNNPYEYKPTYDENVIDTTPFNKVETNQDNFMSRESIFSTSGNIPQIGNDVFNFGDNTQLPYQDHSIEKSYLDEPVANEIKIENYEAPNSQMPTLVPVQPEIVITQPEEEPAQEGYKQIVPNVAQMEIIETPDFNNMTTSMIEDHINNMDLEQLAETQTQQDEPDGGYKQIVPDIQEAVIENFDIDDDEEDPDMSVVDNITDTYRAALRATYCSATTDENRFSYRTVDSDHSLLHNMRENGEW